MGDAGPSTPISVLSSGHNTPGTTAEEDHVRDIHVLVTGFGPFKSFTVNPSWLIASSLPKTLEPGLELKAADPIPGDTSRSIPLRPSNSVPYRIHLHVYPAPVRVAYASTSTFIPSLLDPRTNSSHINFDYVLHIGLASGRDSYTLETTAHRDHYKIKDVEDGDGYLPGEYVWKREGVPEKLEVGWEPGDVLRRWEKLVKEADRESIAANVVRTEHVPHATVETNSDEKSQRLLPDNLLFASHSSKQQPSQAQPTLRQAVVKLSRDAGRFLCEFIFMSSLVVRWREAVSQPSSENEPAGSSSHTNAHQNRSPPSAHGEGRKEKIGKVMFLHVPNGVEKADVVRGRMVAENAIRAVVASWEGGWRNPNVYEPEAELVDKVNSPTTMQVGGSGVFETKGTGDA